MRILISREALSFRGNNLVTLRISALGSGKMSEMNDYFGHLKKTVLSVIGQLAVYDASRVIYFWITFLLIFDSGFT